MAGEDYVWRGTVTKTRRKHVRNPETQASTWIDDGEDIADVVVTIKVADIVALLGRRAMSSKARKAGALHGAIVANVSNIRRA